MSLYSSNSIGEESQRDLVFNLLFARISGAQYLAVPPTRPSSPALLAVRRLRAGVAALFSNSHSHALFDGISRDKCKLQIRHRHEHINIYDSFQALVNSPISALPKWSRLCLVRKERLAMVCAFDIDDLNDLLKDCKRMLSELVCPQLTVMGSNL